MDVKISQILDAARYAPSGDNCQPWRAKRFANSFAIYHDELRAKHQLNISNIASVLALGCLYELIKLAAMQLGLEADIELQLNESRLNTCGKPWLIAYFRPTTAPSTTGFSGEWIKNRCVDRRMYKNTPMNSTQKQQLLTLAGADFSGTCHVVEKPSRALMGYIKDAETFMWLDHGCVKDVLKWIRFSRAEVERTRDGMPWTSLGINYLESRLLQLAKFRTFQLTMNKLGFLWNARRLVEKQLRSSSALLVWSITGFSNEQLVEVGRSYYRSWLFLNANHFGVHPLTMSSTGCLFNNLGLVTDNPASVSLFDLGHSLWSSELALPAGDQVVWAMRTGVVPPLSGKARAIRFDTFPEL